MKKIGARVGAIMSADEKEVRFFGYGTYEGYADPPPEVRTFGGENPKIKLDNGKVVFGCECWWGDEAQVKRMIGERAIVEVDIDEVRSKR